MWLLKCFNLKALNNWCGYRLAQAAISRVCRTHMHRAARKVEPIGTEMEGMH